MRTNILQSALKTIELEAKSISELSSFVDDTFIQAVEAIHTSKGRVVVSGIGKSAIIAQKIAATLNSTGTPALFMHAADAIHGDLGMIQSNDVVIVISKSGESPEIKVIVPLIKNFGNTLIGIAGNMNSFLATHADIALNTTVAKEACPNNLAPTTSTTAQMVMGDVLAVCLMELNQFEEKDFARYHPGGNLGKRLYLRVADLYVQNEKPEVVVEASLKEVIVAISKGRLGMVAVTDNNHKIIGVITDGDLRRMLEKVNDNIMSLCAVDIVSKNPKTIHEDILAVNALQELKKYDISQLVVVDHNNIYKGVIHLHDLIREGII